MRGFWSKLTELELKVPIWNIIVKHNLAVMEEEAKEEFRETTKWLNKVMEEIKWRETR